jgi:hypothetical protein
VKRALPFLFLLLLTFSILFTLGARFPLSADNPNPTPSFSVPRLFDSSGDGSNMSDPLLIETDVFQAYEFSQEETYLTFYVKANEIYFIFLDSFWWSAELYDNAGYTILLGTPYTVPGGTIFQKYLFFSPNRTGLYYLKLYKSPVTSTITLAILTVDPYTLNTSEIVTVGYGFHPIQIFQCDLAAGNYTASYDALYARITRGGNYVVLPNKYGTFPTDLFPLANGSYGIVLEESCEFCLTYYVPQNATPPPEDPPGENDTNTSTTGSFFDGITPVFGVGVLIGILVLYKLKKK